MIKPALIALALLATPASATTMLTADAISIVAGQSITFNLFVAPDEGEEFIGFSRVQFDSGDGQTVTTSFGGNVSFTYLTAGEYVARAQVSAVMYLWGGIVHGTRFASETVTVSVPEPATWAMLLLGFVLLSVAAPSRRRRRWLASCEGLQ